MLGYSSPCDGSARKSELSRFVPAKALAKQTICFVAGIAIKPSAQCV
jgi:hypothetical protein